MSEYQYETDRHGTITHPYEGPTASTASSTTHEMRALVKDVLAEMYTTNSSMNELVQRIVVAEVAASRAARSVAEASVRANANASVSARADRDEISVVTSKKLRKGSRGRSDSTSKNKNKSKSKDRSKSKSRSKSKRREGKSKKTKATNTTTIVEDTDQSNTSKTSTTKGQSKKESTPVAVASSASTVPIGSIERINREKFFSHPDSSSVISRISSLNSMSEVTTPTTVVTGCSVSAPNTPEFYQGIVRKLKPHRSSICIQDIHGVLLSNHHWQDRSDSSIEPATTRSTVLSTIASSSSTPSVSDANNSCEDFEAAFGPNDMRCLALVSHNEMKTTMKNFVVHYKNILKKFRLTGTQSTMAMLSEVFRNDPEIVFGPTCKSGPLGGDAELVAMMTSGQLGGLLFFQDPMTSHPHQCDIDCLVRQAQVNNTIIATTPTTALAIAELFRVALTGAGKPELLPSFFFSLQSPTVGAYQESQKQLVMMKKSQSCISFNDVAHLNEC